jgi:hypothetical protein
VICDDALVYFWNCNKGEKWGTYTGLTSLPFTSGTNMVAQWNGHVDSLCPTSGRYAYFDDGDGTFITGSIVVVDLF